MIVGMPPFGLMQKKFAKFFLPKTSNGGSYNYDHFNIYSFLPLLFSAGLFYQYDPALGKKG